MNGRPKGWRRWALVLLPLWLGAALAAAPDGNPNEKYSFDIEAGEAAYRLNDFSTQSGMQLLFGFESMKGIRIRPVRGSYKPFDALDLMLAGTNVRYEFVNMRTVTLTLAPAAALASEPRKLDRSRRKDRRALDETIEQVTILSEYQTPIASTGSAPLSLSRTDIDSLGFTTVQGVVRTLPQVFGGGPTEDTHQVGFEARTNTASGTGINLRGLGASSTLVLMNGRRLASGGSDGIFVDISNLPVAAVERIDILPDSSSTFYGADAVGGVVNFVMRDRFDGAQTEAYFGSATQGQLSQNYVSQIVGGHTDTAHGLLTFDFYSRDSLPAADRSQARSDLREWGGTNFDLLQSKPGNIVFGNSIWAIPRGQDGTDLNASDLQPGTTNFQNRYMGADLLPSQQRWSLFGTGEKKVSDTLTLFSDVLHGQRDVRALSTGQLANLRVPVSNPFYVNPTSLPGPVTVSYNFIDDLGPLTSSVLARNLDANAGFVWTMKEGWNLTATLGHASEQLRLRVDNTFDPVALQAALGQTDPGKAFNPFGDGSNTPTSVIDGIRAQSHFTTHSRVDSYAVMVSGSVGRLPGGDTKLSFGADNREQSFESRTWSSYTSVPLSFDRHRSIQSGFIELRLPLVGESNRVRGAESVEVSLAERYESYSDFGNKLAARFGLAWVPRQGLTVRGSYSQSFRPPGLLDLDESSNAYIILPLRDPQTGGSSNVLIWSGKNRDLNAESARSWTAGLDIEPASLPRTALALTYFDTLFTDRLNQPASVTDLLTNPTLAALVTRDPSTEYRADVCERSPVVGSGGDCLGTPIVAIADLRWRNDAALHTRGIDLLGRYSQGSRFGKFSLGLNGTYILEFSEAQTRDSPLVNRVSTPTYPVNLRVRSSADWERGAWNVSAFVNYLNSYLDTASTPRRKVGSWTTADLRASYTIRASEQLWLGDTTLSLGVENLFDTAPPFLNNSVGIGYDEENGDLTGRIVSVMVRKKW